MIAHTWGAAIAAFLLAQTAAGLPATTIYTRRQHLQHLARGLDAPDPWQLDPLQLVDWVGSQTWAPETRRGRRTTFLAFWRWGLDAGYTDRNPAAALPRVKATSPNPRPLPDDVYQDALRAAGPREALILRLAVELGMRRGEIAVVHSRDIVQDLDGWSLVVHGKGAKVRILPMPRRLALELRALEPGYAFPGRIDGHLSARRVGELATDLLAGDWTIHKGRHKAASTWYRQTGDLARVQKALGHSKPDTTMHYVVVEDPGVRAMIEAAAS